MTIKYIYMGNKIIIDGKEYRVEDMQELEAEVDMNFPDDRKAAKHLKDVIGQLQECAEILDSVKFLSPQVAAPAAQSTQLTLRNEIKFLTEVMRIIAGQ